MSNRIDPDVAAVLASWTPVQFEDPAAQRALAASARRDAPTPSVDERVSIEDRTVAVDGETPVPVRIYRPDVESSGVLVWIHGGAYCIGSVAYEDPICSDLAAGAGVVVVSVEYRLAPEDPFPAGFDDCYGVVSYVAAGGFDDVPAAPLVVGGTSAGAGLAAAVALKARDVSGPAIALQLLLYPFLDDRRRGASFASEADAVVFSAADARVSWDHYLGSGRTEVPVYGSPARATDLTDLPPAYVISAGLDCLRDDAIDYATAMIRAGVDVELHTFPTVPHGFLSLAPDAGVSRSAKAEIHRAVRAAVSR